jgi:hypothetical protein
MMKRISQLEALRALEVESVSKPLKCGKFFDYKNFEDGEVALMHAGHRGFIGPSLPYGLVSFGNNAGGQSTKTKILLLSL